MKYFVLNQLGTPKSPSPQDVGVYLSEFLMDPRIITLGRPWRDILVKIAIVPRRKYASAHKYQTIWQEEGSPLAVNTYQLQKKMQQRVGESVKVRVAMRYGEPSINQVLSEIQREDAKAEIYFLPLYPQYATATVASSIDEVERYKTQCQTTPDIKILEPFYHQPWYIQGLTQTIQRQLTHQDHLLFSYHGIPLSQERQAPASYYQQCLKTTELTAEALGLDESRHSTAFQSRVGLQKWLEPSTTDKTSELVKRGIKHLKVVCPSFVADCLETLEEIGVELREEFLEAGGESFELIPCLNSEDLFIEGLLYYFHEHGN